MFRLALLIPFLTSALAQHPCAAYPSAFSTLEACSTRTAFCSQYLHSSVSYTKTKTETRTKVVPYITRTTTTVTNTNIATVYTATTTVEDTIVVTGTTATVTQTPYATSCPAGGDQNDKRHLNNKRAKQSSSATICGLAPTLRPAAISDACNCLLASSTTVTTTVTSTLSATITAKKTARASTITTISSTTTATTSTVTPTSTVSGPCTQFTTFAMQIANTGTTYDGQYIQLGDDGGDSFDKEDYYFGATADATSASTFSFDSTGHLASIGVSNEPVVGVLYQPSFTGPFAETPQFLEPGDVNGDYYYLSCSVPYPSLDVSCVANTQDTYYLVPADSSGDPAYIYLVNSGEISSGNFDPANFDPPAVPASLVAVPLDV